MSNPKDITGQILNINREGALTDGPKEEASPPPPKDSLPPIRPMSRDLFLYGVYGLLMLAAVAQIAFIVWVNLL